MQDNLHFFVWWKPTTFLFTSVQYRFNLRHNTTNKIILRWKLEFHTTSQKQMGGVFSIYMWNTSIGTCAKFCFRYAKTCIRTNIYRTINGKSCESCPSSKGVEYSSITCHKPLLRILSTGLCNPSQLSEGEHCLQLDTVPISNDSKARRCNFSCTANSTKEKFCWM